MLVTNSYRKNTLSELALHFVSLHLTYLCIILAFWNPSILFLLFPLFCFERYRFLMLILFSMKYKLKKLNTELGDTEIYNSNSEMEQNLLDELNRYELQNNIKKLNVSFGVEPVCKTLIKRTPGYRDYTTYNFIFGTSYILLPGNYKPIPGKIVKRIHEQRHLFGHGAIFLQLWTYILFMTLLLCSSLLYCILNGTFCLFSFVLLFTIAFACYKIDRNQAIKELDADIGTIRIFENYQKEHSDSKMEDERSLPQTAAYHLIIERHFNLTGVNNIREFIKKKKTFRYTKYMLPFLSSKDYSDIISSYPTLKKKKIPKYNSTSQIYIAGDNYWEIIAWLATFALSACFLIPFVSKINYDWYFILIAIPFAYAFPYTKTKITRLCKKIESIIPIGE